MKSPHPVIAELKQDRVDAGLSVSAVAGRIYLTATALYGRESGYYEPANLADLDRWAALFGKRVALIPVEAERQFGEAS